MAINLLSTLPSEFLIPYLYPRFYAIHEMSDECGLPGPEGIIMPPLLNLNIGLIKSYGLYLLDNGQVQFLWIGRDAVPELVNDVFGLSSVEVLKAGKVSYSRLVNDRLPFQFSIIHSRNG
jgi:protein transport protein SEC24